MWIPFTLAKNKQLSIVQNIIDQVEPNMAQQH
jgi:hypothetical protein